MTRNYRELIVSAPASYIPCFKDFPEDVDTTYFFREVILICDSTPATIEEWLSCGTKGLSVVFRKSEADSPEKAMDILRKDPLYNECIRFLGSFTYSDKNPRYLFLNWILDID